MKEMIYDCRDPILPPFRVVSKGAKIGLYFGTHDVSAAAAGGTVKSMRQFRLLTSRKARCYSPKNFMICFSFKMTLCNCNFKKISKRLCKGANEQHYNRAEKRNKILKGKLNNGNYKTKHTLLFCNP